jgi:creatinine amidohydrolase
VFLPVQAVGASDEHSAFRGTLTLSPETALRAFIEIGESVHRAGIRKLVIINSHGGNITLIDLAARQLRVRHACWRCTPRGAASAIRTAVQRAERTHGIHGGDIETSIMLAAYPDLVRREKIADFSPAPTRWSATTYPARGLSGRLRLDDAGPARSGRSAMPRSPQRKRARLPLDHGARAFVALLHGRGEVRSRPARSGPARPTGARIAADSKAGGDDERCRRYAAGRRQVAQQDGRPSRW